jgi:cobalt-zinc-cadmium efflux system protein
MSDCNNKEHTHHQDKEARLGFTAAINMVTVIVQIVGGVMSGSLALLSDALHNMSDVVALVIAYWASRLSRKERTDAKTFGHKRAEVLAALFNAGTLIVVALFLFKEAVMRFWHPNVINGWLMLSVASVGLLANLVSVLLLRKHAGEDMNTKAAFVHLLSDTLSSVAVIIGGWAVAVYQIFWIDPLLTVLISGFIFRESIAIIKDCVHVLMQFAPRGISVPEIIKTLKLVEGVAGVHHVHLWSVNGKDVYFEGHIELNAKAAWEDLDTLRVTIEKILWTEYTINHTTLQFERGSCLGHNSACGWQA